MNAKNYLLNMLLVGSSIVMLSSCEKDDVYNPDKAKKTTDLIVPDGFDWATTHDVTISMQSPVETSVSIYLDKDCNQLIAELPVKVGANSVVLSVPSANADIWMKYPVQNGGEEMQKVVIQKTTTRNLGEAGQWTAESLFPDYAEKASGNTAIYQPNKTKFGSDFGTIMFEDMWPTLGDYDFNDFVINYKSTVTCPNYGADKVIYVDMELKLRAMGGSLPYRFCIQVGNKSNTSANMNILSKDVKLTNVDITNNDGVGGNVELLPATHAIVALTGFEKLKRNTGGAYYNTEAGHLIDNSKTPVIKFRLEIRPSDVWSKYMGFGSEFAFDYFLQNTQNAREIHFIDYPPTELYENYEADLGNRNQTTYYCSEKNFVWALKAPVEMGWDIETVDIKDVYPDFAKWVSYGGDWIKDGSWTDSNRPWYNTHNDKGYIDPSQH